MFIYSVEAGVTISDCRARADLRTSNLPKIVLESYNSWALAGTYAYIHGISNTILDPFAKLGLKSVALHGERAKP